MHVNKRKVRRYIFEGEDNSTAIEAYQKDLEREKQQKLLSDQNNQKKSEVRQRVSESVSAKPWWDLHPPYGSKETNLTLFYTPAGADFIEQLSSPGEPRQCARGYQQE